MLEIIKFFKSLKIWDIIYFIFLFLIILLLYIYFIGFSEFKNIKDLVYFFNLPIYHYFLWVLISLIFLLILITEIIFNNFYFWFKYMIVSIQNYLKNNKKVNSFLQGGLQLYFNILDFYIYVLIIAFVFYVFTNFYNYWSISLNIIYKIFTDWVFLIFGLSWLVIIFIKNFKEVFKIIFTSKIFNNLNFFLIFTLITFSKTYDIVFLEYFLFHFFIWIYAVWYMLHLVYTQINSSNDYQVDFFHKSFKDAVKENKSYRETYQKFKVNLKSYWIPNTINLNIDYPIQSQYEDNDILWHNKYAKNIFDLIYGFDMNSIKNSYSIWIVWEWWIGKSWIINMIKNDWIKSRNDMIFYEFNPWNFEKNDLVNNFFSDLSKELEISNIWSILTKYASIIWNIDPIKWYSFVKDIFNFILPDKSIHDIKGEINKKLEKYNKKIIISIDDLDRCTPDEVMMMLNIIKNLWNFKNIIYIVSYDKENVLNVLKDKKFSENYLDKIINTEIFVSKPSWDQIRDYFINWLRIILENALMNDSSFSSENDRKIFIDNQLSIFKSDMDYNIVMNSIVDEIHFNTTNVNHIFKVENLRFIKKLLNHLNLIISRKLNQKSKFIDKEGDINHWNQSIHVYTISILLFIVVINYIKIKKYDFFIFIFNALKKIQSWESITYKKNLSPKVFVNFEMSFLCGDFFYYICSLRTNENFDNIEFVGVDLQELINDLDNFTT